MLVIVIVIVIVIGDSRCELKSTISGAKQMDKNGSLSAIMWIASVLKENPDTKNILCQKKIPCWNYHDETCY